MQFFIITVFVRYIFYNYICDMFFHSIDLRFTKIGCRETTIFYFNRKSKTPDK